MSEFTKDKVIWTKAMNLHLAKFMEGKSNIWDPKHPKFSHIGTRDETFAEFAAQYDDLTWQAVKDRWTNIRSTFGFYMRKIKTAKEKSGRVCIFRVLPGLSVPTLHDARHEFKVGWFMWKPCKYLFSVHKYVKSQKSTEQSTEDAANEDNEISNDGVFSDTSEDGRNGVSCQEIVNNITTVLKNVKNENYEVRRSKYAAVGDSVTTMLSQLDSYEAAQLSQKIVEILAEYDARNPMNPNGLRYDLDSK